MVALGLAVAVAVAVASEDRSSSKRTREHAIAIEPPPPRPADAPARGVSTHEDASSPVAGQNAQGGVDPDAAHRIARLIAAYDALLAAQSFDPGWSRAQERGIAAFFASDHRALVGSRLLDAECRTNLCRLRLAHDSRQAASRFSRLIGPEAPFDASWVLLPSPARETSTVFLARGDEPITLAPFREVDGGSPAEDP